VAGFNDPVSCVGVIALVTDTLAVSVSVLSEKTALSSAAPL
jgi:hypothetical protein